MHAQLRHAPLPSPAPSSRLTRTRSVLVWQSGLLRMLVDDPSSLRLPVYKEAVRAIGSLAGSPALLPLPSPDNAPDTARNEASAAEARVRFGLSLMAQELIVAFRLPHPRPRHQRRAPGAGEPQTRQVSQARHFIRGASEPAAAGKAAAVTAVAEGLEAAEDAGKFWIVGQFLRKQFILQHSCQCLILIHDTGCRTGCGRTGISRNA